MPLPLPAPLTDGVLHAVTAAAAPSESFGLTGLSAWVADTMAALGWAGVGMMTFLETLLPVIPSEVVLPLAGFLAYQGSINLVAAFVAATVGTALGAQALYEIARAVGLERSMWLLAHVPFVDRDDADAAQRWFVRHGRGAVFFGRLIPGVRSLISLPAGASGMHRGQFAAYTLAGSTIWNLLLIGAGYGLGSQWQKIEGYTTYLNDVVYGAIVLVGLWLVVRSLRRTRARRAGTLGPPPPARPADAGPRTETGTEARAEEAGTEAAAREARAGGPGARGRHVAAGERGTTTG